MRQEAAELFTREDGSRIVDLRDDWYALCVSSRLGQYVLAKRTNTYTAGDSQSNKPS